MDLLGDEVVIFGRSSCFELKDLSLLVAAHGKRECVSVCGVVGLQEVEARKDGCIAAAGSWSLLLMSTEKAYRQRQHSG